MGYTFGFIGAGNMGGALARAACRWRPEQVVLTDRTLDKAVALAEELDCDIDVYKRQGQRGVQVCRADPQDR